MHYQNLYISGIVFFACQNENRLSKGQRVSVTIVRRTSHDVMRTAREASGPNHHWWMAVKSLIELQEEDGRLLRGHPLVYAPFWRWVADEAHRTFPTLEDSYKFSRSAVVIARCIGQHPGGGSTDTAEPRRTQIGQITSVWLPLGASKTVELFLAKTEPRFD